MMDNGTNSLSTVYKDADLIAVEYENLLNTLTQKQEELIKVKEEFTEREFNIKYIEDIDFKKLYGKANEDIRRHHVQVTLKDLYDKKQSLELEVEHLKRRVSFLKAVLYLKADSYGN